MIIELFVRDNSFRAIASTTFFDPLDVNFSFILNSKLCIDKLICNHKLVENYSISTVTPEFRPNSNRITFCSDSPIKSLFIHYTGIVDNWYNIITEDLISLNWYSVWFPQDTSLPVTNEKVLIYGCSNYVILKATYDSTLKVWVYDNTVYDPCNIIAYKKDRLLITTNSYITIYYSNEILKNITNMIADYYKDIIKYYNGKLFEKTTVPVLDLAFLYPTLKDYGSFKRKDLIVTTESEEDEYNTIRMVAHELAHLWCFGADYNSWEDWLNETTAEWSALLYALTCGNNLLFDYILQPHIESVSTYPPIKTSDRTRPLGVHTKGTVLFFELYQKFGLQVMEQLIRIFANLETKSTSSYLTHIKIELGDDIYAYLVEGIDR